MDVRPLDTSVFETQERMGDSHLFLPFLLLDLTFSGAADHPAQGGRLKVDRRCSPIVTPAVLPHGSFSPVSPTPTGSRGPPRSEAQSAWREEPKVPLGGISRSPHPGAQLL